VLKEEYLLRPGDSFRIGNLEFLTERFNTGAVADDGGKNKMEDEYSCMQDLCLYDNVNASLFCVFDGHGGY
jgi:serine/threonine protein phosphatase PrpC